MISARVCLVSYEFPPDVGGLGKSTARIAALLADRYDIEVVALTRSIPPGQIRLEREGGISVRRVGKPDSYSEIFTLLRSLVSILDNDHQFDLFHGIFLPAADAFIDIAGTRPTIASIRGNDAVKWLARPERLSVVKRVVSKATCVTSVCADLLDRVVAVCNICGYVEVIPNSINVDQSAGVWSHESSFRGCIGTVANFRLKKNTEFLLRAFARLPIEARSRLLLCGGFELEPSLEQRLRLVADELGIADQVVFTGSVKPGIEVCRLLKTMHIFAITSDHDGLPNALLESAAIGVPIVTTNVGGMRDLMRNRVHGLLVEPGNVAEFSDALLQILCSDELAATLSTGALALATSLAPQEERSRWSALYDRLLA